MTRARQRWTVLLSFLAWQLAGCGLLLASDSVEGAQAAREGLTSTTTTGDAGPLAEASAGDSRPGHCGNGVLDSDESDVDCGGSCGPCALGKTCANSTDCASGWCSSARVCASSSYAERVDGLVAYYDFTRVDGDRLLGGLGFPDGTMQPGHGFVPGPFGTGDTALAVPVESGASSEGYAWAPHDSVWNLGSGSIDLWLRTPGLNEPGASISVQEKPVWGLVSRDAVNAEEPNHFALMLLRNPEASDEAGGWLFVRQQVQQPEGSVGSHLQSFSSCSDTEVKPGVWQHIALNFGAAPLEMFINGVRQTREECPSSAPGSGAFPGDEDPEARLGIDGNREPFVFGHASIGTSPFGHEETFLSPEWYDTRFSGGALAHIRISARRQDFTDPALRLP